MAAKTLDRPHEHPGPAPASMSATTMHVTDVLGSIDMGHSPTGVPDHLPSVLLLVAG